MKEEKKYLRESILVNLKCLDPKKRLEKEKKIREELFGLEHFKRSRCVFCYLSTAEEVDTFGIIEQCLKMEKKVVVPKVNSRTGTLEIREIQSIHQCERGAYGILEPNPEKTKATEVKDIDLALVPGLAFDEKGHRLGRGKGFFDRFLPCLSAGTPRIALCFDFQKLKSLPSEIHDQTISAVISA